MSLTSCLKKAGTALRPQDKVAVLALSRQYRSQGMTPDAAAIKAVDDQLVAVRGLIERAEAHIAAIDAIDAAAHEAATSPLNDLQEPTQLQQKAGNYRLGHVDFQGLDISIENPAGSVRRGTDKDGVSWESNMANHYGYVKLSKGADGDHVDVFLGPNPKSQKVFVVDQVDESGAFDEHKCMLGFGSADEAKAAYLANYEEGWGGLGGMTQLPMAAFKAWVKSGRLRDPLSEELMATT